MSDIRVKISSDSIPETIVYPGWGDSIDFEETQQQDQVFFLTEFPEMQFKGPDYTLVKSAGGCEEITVKVEERCNGTWIERHRGTFTDYDEKVNENQCWLTVKPETTDDYKCLFAHWEDEVVVYGPGAEVEVSPVKGKYESGKECCTVCYDGTPSGPVCEVPDGYCFQGNIDLGPNPATCDGENETRWRSCFHRIVGTGTLTTPPTYGTGWTHLSGVSWWRCPSANELEGGAFKSGKLLSDVIQNLVAQMACGITARSHFFGINATHDAPPDEAAAYYEYAETYLHHLTIHQKSDVKRPFADDPAESSAWKMTLKKFLEDMWTIFEVPWKMEGSDLILEHWKYFPANEGLDVSGQDLSLEYGKADTGAPEKETFYWMDRAAWSIDFKGYPITYDCGKGNKDRQVQLFSTEVFYINRVENWPEVSDTGFVMIANEVIDGKLYIMNDNKPLGWMMLHDNLHREYRYFIEGTMNNEPTTFNSVRRTRELAPFQVTLCCDDEFDETNEIVTILGPVTPKKVRINYAAGKNTRTLTINSNI